MRRAHSKRCYAEPEAAIFHLHGLSSQATQGTAMSEQQPQPPVFSIEKLYVKDLSLEVPNAPKVFLEREQPAIEVQLNTISAGLDQGIYEVTVTVTLTAKIGDKTMFLVEATQAGIFQIRNVPDAEMEAVLGIGWPNIIFSYARGTIVD